MRSVFCLAIVAMFATISPSYGQVSPFNIELDYSGDARFQAAFDAAEAVWESVITGWEDGINIESDNGGNTFYNIGDNLSSLFIEANVTTIDGAGGVLGSAGPNQFVNDGSVWLASHGAMTFDSADIARLDERGQLEAVILHEMGHVLGIGTLWTTNRLYTRDSGRYTGENALAQYRQEFNNNATFVPVELGGGGGTANGHWDETRAISGGDTVLDPDGLTVIDPNNANFGKSRTAALMTGVLDSGDDTFISATTLGSLQDLGYTVDFSITQAVPEPSSAMAVILLGIAGLSRRRRASLSV